MMSGKPMCWFTNVGEKRLNFIENIPILPVGILDFCKQKLLAPPMKPMNQLKSGKFCILIDRCLNCTCVQIIYMQLLKWSMMQSTIAQQHEVIMEIGHDDLLIELGHDAILWVILVGITQHTDLLIRIGDDAILCCYCAIGWCHN